MDNLKTLFNERKTYWENKWLAEALSEGWAVRGIPPELFAQWKNGWLPASGKVLDVGCGMGDTAAWFVDNGYEAVAFDIAQNVIDMAHKKHGDKQGKLGLMTLDICQQPVPGGPYDIIIDRGCLHSIPGPGVKTYVQQVNAVANPQAKLVLFCAAYRAERPYGDPAEKAQHIQWMQRTFAGCFKLERANDTYLDTDYGKGPTKPLPGIAFWFSKI